MVFLYFLVEVKSELVSFKKEKIFHFAIFC